MPETGGIRSVDGAGASEGQGSVRVDHIRTAVPTVSNISLLVIHCENTLTGFLNN